MDCQTRKDIDTANRRREILAWLFDNTLPQTINIAVQSYRFHAIYHNKEKFLVHKFFDGHRLHYSVFMADMFNTYLTPGQELQVEQVSRRIKELKRTIKTKKRYREDHSLDVIEHNQLCDTYTDLMKGVNAFIKAYNSHRKKAAKK